VRRQDTMRTPGKPRSRRCVALAGGMLIALGAAASPAPADPGYALNLSAPATATVGQPVVIQANGSNPATDFFSSWLDVSAIPASVLSACPAGYLNASQIASSTFAQGGEVVANGQRENVDAAGNFSMPIVYTPKMPGRFLVCGYTNDGATYTLATASLLLTVEGSSTPGRVQSPAPVPGQGIAKPVNMTKPRVRRSGNNLVCKRGSWSNWPTRFSYSWLVSGKAKNGARRQKLPITPKLRGRSVQCKVTASNAAGASTVVSRRYMS
jgi:hypothetical protein